MNNQFEMPTEVKVKKMKLDELALDNELWKWQIANKILVLNTKRSSYAGYYCPSVEGVETWRISPEFQSIDAVNTWMKNSENQGKIMAAIIGVIAAIGVVIQAAGGD